MGKGPEWLDDLSKVTQLKEKLGIPPSCGTDHSSGLFIHPLPVHSLRSRSSVWASQWFLRDLEPLASGRGASAATSTESGFGLGGEVEPLLGPPGTYRPFGDDPRNVFDLGGHQSHFQLPWEIPGP